MTDHFRGISGTAISTTQDNLRIKLNQHLLKLFLQELNIRTFMKDRLQEGGGSETVITTVACAVTGLLVNYLQTIQTNTMCWF